LPCLLYNAIISDTARISDRRNLAIHLLISFDNCGEKKC